MSSEYRIVIKFPKNTKINTKIIPMRSEDHAISYANGIEVRREKGTLFSFWDDARVSIETREVSRWKKID